jgi:hypothetical protein
MDMELLIGAVDRCRSDAVSLVDEVLTGNMRLPYLAG